MTCRLCGAKLLSKPLIFLLIKDLQTNFSEVLIKIKQYSFRKLHLKMQSAEWRPIALNLNVLMVSFNPFVAINMFKKKKGDPKEFPNPGPVDRVAMKKKRVMWQEEVLCDFTLTTSDGKDFPVHQVHLACVSDYMRAMLNGKHIVEWSPGPRLNIKTVLSTYGVFHVKDKTAVRTSYL